MAAPTCRPLVLHSSRASSTTWLHSWKHANVPFDPRTSRPKPSYRPRQRIRREHIVDFDGHDTFNVPPARDAKPGQATWLPDFWQGIGGTFHATVDRDVLCVKEDQPVDALSPLAIRLVP